MRHADVAAVAVDSKDRVYLFTRGDAAVLVYEQDGRYLLPLPHASGVSRWLNDPANRALVNQALAHLSRLRVDLNL